MMNINLNNEKNGIELRFDSKPDSEILSKIKEAGFKYSRNQNMWYAKQTEERMMIANSICGNEFTFMVDKELNQKNSNNYDLWELTRTDDIENNYEKKHICDIKEITAIIRKHLKSRFRICKWSITTKNRSIYVSIMESPFEKDSEILKAIAHYAYKFAQSYNYDNSDHMSDYFDVNFYGVYEHNIIDKYEYKMREITDSEKIIENEFNSKKEAFDLAKKEREEKEFEKQKIQAEIDKKNFEERLAKYKKNHNDIESNIIVEDKSYFILDCNIPDTSKENTIEEYKDCEMKLGNCQISRNVYMTSEIYDLFSKQLLDDFTFVSGMGGTATDDARIKNTIDFNYMSKEEKNTVEWFYCKCVAVFCDNILKLVINPEGYGYSRYVYFVDSNSKIVNVYKANLGISNEELEKNHNASMKLESIISYIISSNGLGESWNTDNFSKFKYEIKKWIRENDFNLYVGVIRELSTYDQKNAMYRVITEIDGIQEQFSMANLKENQKITIIKISAFGTVLAEKVYFKSYENGSYAQYNNAVKVIYRPSNKRNDYYSWEYKEVIICDGWIDIPDSLFWEECDGSTDGVKITKTKLLSFDKSQYGIALEYLKENDITPIINTYNVQL